LNRFHIQLGRQPETLGERRMGAKDAIYGWTLKRKRIMTKEILVVGGGIAGMQAALDLADMGLKVHLVEKLPSIGGKMAQLDKTFPTNDCAI
jgi:heterodisulfide reductase subunit A-like polyferredoxin